MVFVVTVFMYDIEIIRSAWRSFPGPKNGNRMYCVVYLVGGGVPSVCT